MRGNHGEEAKGDVSGGELFWTSLSALIPVFCLVLVGVLAVKYKVVDESGVKALSMIINWILIPCMFFVRLGGSLSVQVFKETWTLAVVGAFSIALNALVSTLILSPLAKPTESFRRWLIFGSTFPNVVAIPLVFVNTVCGQLRLTGTREVEGHRRNHFNHTDGDSEYILTTEECIERGELYVFIYILVPTLVMFIVSSRMKAQPNAVVGDRESSRGGDGESNAERSQSESYNLDSSESFPSAAHAGGETVELELTDSENRFEETSFRTSTTEKPHTEELHRQEGREEEVRRNSRRFTIAAFRSTVLSVLLQPAIASQLVAMCVGFVKPLQDFFFAQDSVITPFMTTPEILAQAVVPIVNLSLASSLGLKIRKTSWANFFGGSEQQVGISRRTLIVFVVGRMVVIPAISFSILYLIMDFLPENPLLRLILFFETAMPSANMCVVLATFNGCHAEGEILSLGMVHQYLLAILTMSLWCFLALYLTF